jgi:hypothetical protein
MQRVFSVFIIVALSVVAVSAIKFHVKPSTEMCIADDFRPDELVVGSAKVEPIQPGMRLEFKVCITSKMCRITS